MMTEVDRVGVHPRTGVATYRVFRLDKAGHMTGAARVFEAPDDVTAIARARALMGNRHPLVIWEGTRLVGPSIVPEHANE